MRGIGREDKENNLIFSECDESLQRRKNKSVTGVRLSSLVNPGWGEVEKCSQEIAILKLGLKEQEGSQGNPRGEVIKGIPSRAISTGPS